MSLATQQETTSTNTRSENIDVIITSSGGRDMPRAAHRGGALVGINSSKKPPDDIPVEFIDWPFLEDEFDFSTHLDVVKAHNPKYAVSPDIRNSEEFTSRIAQADRLRRHAETVIVVPKGVKPSRIPSRFRVGLPAQDRFGGVPHHVWEYRNCDSVHILGGSPARQNELSHYVKVHSVDTASPLKAAQFGSVWDGKWREKGHNYYDRIERSMGNLVKKWNDEVNDERVNLCRLEVEQPDPCPLPDERKARPRSREQLCIRDSEREPFPGREYFHREDTLTHSQWVNERDDMVL